MRANESLGVSHDGCGDRGASLSPNAAGRSLTAKNREEVPVGRVLEVSHPRIPADARRPSADGATCCRRSALAPLPLARPGFVFVACGRAALSPRGHHHAAIAAHAPRRASTTPVFRQGATHERHDGERTTYRRSGKQPPPARTVDFAAHCGRRSRPFGCARLCFAFEVCGNARTVVAPQFTQYMPARLLPFAAYSALEHR